MSNNIKYNNNDHEIIVVDAIIIIKRLPIHKSTHSKIIYQIIKHLSK